MNPISVIIPIYKVEKYLERCVRSVMAQTYSNLEIILVDDGSPDACGKICDDLAEEDSRIKVIHKPNGGVSEARNCGVTCAMGEYITFVDPDDFVSVDYVEYLYGLLKENNADISCCYYKKVYDDTADFEKDINLPKIQILSGWDACKRSQKDLYEAFMIVWGKLYKSELIKKHSFPVGRVHEDEATMFKFLFESNKVVIGNKELYAYYQRSDSIMGKKRNQPLNADAIWALEHRGYTFEQWKEFELARDAWNFLLNQCISESLEHNGIHNAYLKTFSRGKRISIKSRLWLTLYNIHPRLYKLFIYILDGIKNGIKLVKE